MLCKSFFLILFLLLFICSTSAQYQTNVVFWGEAPECGSKKIVDQSGIVCSQTEDDGMKVFIVENNDVKVNIKPEMAVSYFYTYVIIENRSGKKVNMDTSAWRVGYYENEESFLKGEPPIANLSSVKFSRTTTSYRSGVSSSNIGVPSPEPSLTTIPKNVKTDSSSKMFKNTLIRNKTVDSRKTANGVVFFGKRSASKYILIFIHVGDTTFVFPYQPATN